MPERGPRLTVDIIIERPDERILLVERKYPPPGFAIPGGFVEYGETVEQAAAREAFEETGLRVANLRQLRVYSAPDRDPRHHTVSVVFTADGPGRPRAGDDAKHVIEVDPANPGVDLAFDHAEILRDYLAARDRRS